MEGNGEISDTDSGIILHSGSDSPTTTTKDVTTHTRAMKLKHQALQDRLQLCVLELKKLCIREAELTGELSADYPLAPGETPPKVRRRIGAAFQLDEQSIPRGPEESQLNLVDAELALQLKIYEAARRLVREEHQNKAVRRSRVQQCRREERKVKELQESAFQLRLQHGRSSPLPAFSIPLQERGNSDDSSLSDSPVLDEEVHHPQPSSGPPYRDPNHLPQTFSLSSPSTPNSSILSSPVASQPHTPISRTPSQLTPSQLTPIKRTLSHHAPIKRTPSQLTPSRLTPIPLTPIPLTPSQHAPGQLTPSRQGSPGLDSVLSFTSNPETEAPPIQPSPWTESSLDQPFQKTKKSRSSTKSTTSSTTPSQVLPPLEVCLANAGLPQQMSKLKLSTSLSNGSPSSPEPRLHRNLSLRISNPETPLEERTRGRTRSARRRLTDYSVTIPEASRGNPAAHHGTPEAPGGNPAGHYGTPEAPGGNPAGHYGTPEAPGGNPAGHYGTPEAARGNPAGHYGTPEAARGNPAGHYGTPEAPGGNPAGHYGTPEAARGNPAGHYGTPEAPGGNPAGHYGTPEAPGGNPAGHYGTPEAARGIPAGHYGTPEAARGIPAGHYGTPEAPGGNPAGHYGTPEAARGIPAGRYGTPEAPGGHYGTPEAPSGNPAGHYGTPEAARRNPSGHYGTPEAARGIPAGHYGTPEALSGNPAGHYGTPEAARRNPSGHYGTPEVAWGSPLGHYGYQEDSEDSHSEHSWTTCTGSVCQEEHSEFPRARQFQHPSPTGGPGPHAFQSPGIHQILHYQASPGFNRGHYAGDVAYALDLDLARGYHDHRARSIRRDYLYAEAPGPAAAAAPRRAPQQAGLSRSPSLWEHGPGLPRQLVDDQLKSWHQRSQFRGARPRSLDRQGAVRVKTAPDWVSPLAHHQRYQEQVMTQRVFQRTAEDGPGHWFGDDSSKIVSQV